MRIEVVNSPDDGGYYAEVIDDNGKTVYTTEVASSSRFAETLGCGWISRQVFESSKRPATQGNEP